MERYLAATCPGNDINGHWMLEGVGSNHDGGRMAPTCPSIGGPISAGYEAGNHENSVQLFGKGQNMDVAKGHFPPVFVLHFPTEMAHHRTIRLQPVMSELHPDSLRNCHLHPNLS
ncbi:UNVERIFIED_CONTAM: hypothetical protein K2H54_009481 [Gekko kuhli]